MQESVGESRVSHPAPRSTTNNLDDPFGPATEEEMEAELGYSCLQAGFTMGELQSSAIPNSVIPSNVRFLSYENMKKSVTGYPAAMQHPWVQGALAVTGKL